jgi:fructose/tagatose bisphosphate aldolase
MTAAVRKVLAEKPAEFDPRKYLGPARDKLKDLYVHKITMFWEVTTKCKIFCHISSHQTLM